MTKFGHRALKKAEIAQSSPFGTRIMDMEQEKGLIKPKVERNK